MPRKTIDYSNTIFYKIQSNDANIPYVYVDFTTNFINKKNTHKKNANNTSKHNIRLYSTIENNGGWYNWTMSKIAVVNCKNKEEAYSKKEEYEKMYCQEEETTEMDTKMKSIVETNMEESTEEKDCETVGDNKFFCKKCLIHYSSKSGLWRHKKKCQSNDNLLIDIMKENQTVDTATLTQLVIDSVKQNQEFQKQMFDLMKDNMDLIKDNLGTHHINSHNKTTNNQFNLQFFLNETCKDAMNINDFIDYVKVNLDDFENFGKVGYPKALGEIIVRNLNELDIKIRPIHCTDLKREVLHVKHDGVWHSDDTQKFIKRSITYVANKNIRQRPQWQEENPESKNFLSTTFERYNNICLASLGPATDEQEADFLKKITSTIAREVVIDKKKKY
jgi:hypothetical protein